MHDEMKGVRQRVADTLAMSIAGNYCRARGQPARVRESCDLGNFPNIQQVEQQLALEHDLALKLKS